MNLTREVVEHIAELAKLELTHEEIELLCEELSDILGYAEMLNRLDTDAIPPTAHVIDQQSVMRDDEPRPSMPTEEVLANAPARDDDCFLVQEVLPGDEYGP